MRGDAIMNYCIVFYHTLYIIFLTLVYCLVDRGFYCNYQELDFTPNRGLVPVPPNIHSYIYLFYHYVTCFHKAAPSTLYSRESRTPGSAIFSASIRVPRHPRPKSSKHKEGSIKYIDVIEDRQFISSSTQICN